MGSESGLTFAEVAQQRGISPSGARAQFRRNRNVLTPGVDYIEVDTITPRCLLTITGVAKLWRSSMSPRHHRPVSSPRYNVSLSVC